ncbi:type IX secretion system outer membrane channel protein PorV [Lacinutrix jangbogonensis]|uniref:type IX secretion system outer membrane channel protein PorV n=1 Tax=Lacinutrix jangbogonensis TaxID=1469557 RepID=UPI00053E5792|nr:type IX secretion system outer membrane channel protein PorV [Lacinutrix jangbogonensis]
MKKNILIIIVLVFAFKSNAQNSFQVEPYQDSRVITTGVPFLLIASDARAAAMGDMGVATSPDAFSQQWNASKYVFSTDKSGIAVSYTPYLSKLVNDIFLGSVTYFNRINEQSAFAASFRYFSLGDIEFVEDENSTPLLQSPNELAIDLSYALRLSDQFGMAVGMRYLRSDLKLNFGDNDVTAGSTFGVDISGYYQSEEEAYNDFNGRWRGGFALQNLGPKFKYDEGGQENFQPTTLRLGGGFDFIFDQYNKLGATVEFAKLLVPTPPVRGREIEYVDDNGDGMYNAADDTFIGEKDVIISGQDNNVDFVSGIFQSFGDAPGGGKEELQEFTYAVGLEYLYQDSFAFRAGYFNEHETKGARKFFALGAGFKYNVINIDLSYLFSASKVQSPLESTLRFSLTFNLGEGEYTEY